MPYVTTSQQTHIDECGRSGGGKPSAHQGTTRWNNWNDDITKDTFGINTAKKLGIRVAEAALKVV
ncbi:MAG TPA: hypothetical protein ENN97_06645 [Phycisphaerales bacterium]|nr:hypothetical protein [Phycisphaerales bacterium]